jgi:hypothetical protein
MRVFLVKIGGQTAQAVLTPGYANLRARCSQAVLFLFDPAVSLHFGNLNLTGQASFW